MTTLSQLQEDVAQRLADELPKFTGGRVGWQIVTEVKGDVVNMVKKSLLKIGIGICVFTPTWKRGEDIESRRNTRLIVSVVETQTINMSSNGMRVPGIDLCWCVDGILSGFAPSSGWAPLLFQSCEVVDSPFAGSNNWDIEFLTSTHVAVEEATYDELPIDEAVLSKP